MNGYHGSWSRHLSLHPPHPFLVPESFQRLGNVPQSPQEPTVGLIWIMWWESGVYASRRRIDVSDISLPAGDFFDFWVLSVEVLGRIFVHRRVGVGKPVLTGGRVGEIDDSEVDLTAFSGSRIVATLGGGSDHEVFAVGSAKGDGRWGG